MDALASYIGSLRFPDPPEPPAEMLPLLSEGKQIFFSKEAGCVQCHPPPLYTDSGQRDAEGRLLLHDVGTCLPCCGRRHSRLDTPSLLGLYRSDPYLHHGQAKTLQEVFTKFNPGDRHGGTSRLGEHEIRALAEFLRYLKRGS
jgi:cytochrome c peroxidase